MIGPVGVQSNKWQENTDVYVSTLSIYQPTWNNATPPGLFHLKVDNEDQYARWLVNATATDPGVPAPIPVSYSAAGAATLYSGQ